MFILFFFFFRTWWGKLFLQSRPQTKDVSPSHFGGVDLVQLEGRLKTFHLGGLVILQRRRHSLGEQGFRWHWIVVILLFLLHQLSCIGWAWSQTEEVSASGHSHCVTEPPLFVRSILWGSSSIWPIRARVILAIILRGETCLRGDKWETLRVWPI